MQQASITTELSGSGTQPPSTIDHRALSSPTVAAHTVAVGGIRGLVKRVIGPETFVAARSMFRLATANELQAPLPYSFKLWAWRRGFQARHAAIYDRAGVEAGEYVSDYARRYRCITLNPIPTLFRHKLLLRRTLADRGFAQPATLALVTQHGIIADPLGAAAQVTGAELEARLVAEGGRFIIKPEDGLFGRQISLIEARDGIRLVARRGRREQPFSVERDAAPGMVIERAVEQHEFWQALSPYSVNTMRVLTMWTPGDAAPFIGRAVQRIGTESTLPTDNWAGGSVCARIDLETGTLSAGRISPEHADVHEDRPYTHHPDTGAPIAGIVLPNWEHIKEVVLAAAQSVPYARYVGWDVAIDRSGTTVFIEGNHNSSVDLLQVHGGLLADPAVRRFYEVCGVI